MIGDALGQPCLESSEAETCGGWSRGGCLGHLSSLAYISRSVPFVPSVLLSASDSQLDRTKIRYVRSRRSTISARSVLR